MEIFNERGIPNPYRTPAEISTNAVRVVGRAVRPSLGYSTMTHVSLSASVNRDRKPFAIC